MRTFFVLSLIALVAGMVSAQQTADVIATVAGKNLTPASLSVEGQKLYAGRNTAVAELRSALLAKMVRDILIEAEARSAGTTAEKLLSAAVAKAAPPTAAELQKIYDANSQAFEGRSFAEVRDELGQYVRRTREQKAVDAYVKSLKAKHKAVAGKDVNSSGLKPGDVLVTVGGKPITAADFDAKNRAAVNDLERNIYEDLKSDLKASILSVLTAEEAKTRGVEASSIYASEVTDKLTTYTEQEKFDLETALEKRLFAKYSPKILLREPESFVQQISVDDDPSSGPASAPVTIVMFSDFQCPACSAAHPVLKKVMAEYPGKIRFIVRDYPLVNLHKNAFRAALAANAAKAQGKFFEYTEILYTHQSELDDASLVRYAESLGLNPKQFELDLNDEKTAAEVRKDMSDAAVYGVSWTPTVYVNGVKVMRAGADDYREAIERALGK